MEANMQIMNSGAEESSKPLFTIEFALQNQDFHSEWTRCSLLANYMAEYVAYQFTERGRAENLISTVVNEILEAITYLTPGESSMSIRCSQLTDMIRLDMDFSVRSDVLEPYMEFMQKFDDIENRYLELLTGEVNLDVNFNQLGLVMLAHDFNVRIDSQLDDSKNSILSQIFVPVEELLT